MNHTNRALNRLLLAIAGLILIAVGGLAAASALDARVRDGWTQSADSAVTWWQNLQSSAPLQDPFGSWWTLALIAALVVLAVLCFSWLTRQGGGRTSTGGTDVDAELGDTAVDVSYLESAVAAAVAGNTSILGSSVTAWRGRRSGARNGLRLTLQTRRGASPRDVADLAEALVSSIDELMGHRATVLVRIVSGTKSKLAGAQRTD